MMTEIHGELHGELASLGQGEPHTPTSPRVVLTWVDRLAFRNFLKTDEENYRELVAHVRDSASSLAGPDRNEARMRMLARALASERARAVLVSAKLDECLVARDFEGAAALERVLMGTTRRMTMLMQEHRTACEAEQRRAVTVAVGHAEHVTIRAGR